MSTNMAQSMAVYFNLLKTHKVTSEHQYNHLYDIPVLLVSESCLLEEEN